MCRSQGLVGQCCRVGRAGVGHVAAFAVLGFVLLISVSGHFLINATQERTTIRTAIEANRGRIDAVNDRLGANSVRLTRVEPRLEERLPPRQ